MGNKSAQDAINNVSSFAPHLIPPRAPMKKYMINVFNTTTKMFLILQRNTLLNCNNVYSTFWSWRQFTLDPVVPHLSDVLRRSQGAHVALTWVRRECEVSTMWHEMNAIERDVSSSWARRERDVSAMWARCEREVNAIEHDVSSIWARPERHVSAVWARFERDVSATWARFERNCARHEHDVSAIWAQKLLTWHDNNLSVIYKNKNSQGYNVS